MIDLKNLSKSIPRKPRIIVYGPSGIGKSTFGAMAPKPIFILTEDGLGDIDVPAIPQDDDGKPRVAASFDEILECIRKLAEEDHDFKTVVIDTLDWLEPLVNAATCKRLKVGSIEDPGYGKGYVETMTEWKEFFDAITYLRDVREMNIIMIAHGAVTKIEDPIHPAYDKNGLKLHKKAAAKAEEYVDVIGFCALRTLLTTEKSAFEKTRNRAISTGEHVLYLSPSAGFVAKNRYHMPDVIPLDWEEFEKYLPGYMEPKVEETKKERDDLPEPLASLVGAKSSTKKKGA